MRVLWVSDSPTVPSGFGNVTRFVCEGLVRRGHDVHILGWQHRGPSAPWNGATIHGVGWHPMGADVLLAHLYRIRPDLLITLGDVWWMTFITDPTLQQYFHMTATRWLFYYPIDGHRADGSLPPSWIEVLRRVDVPIAMSRYGQAMTERAGVPCEYIPHGVATDVFCPASFRSDAKRRLGYEDRFVVLSDARNQPRKMLPRLLTSFARFAEDKDDVLLHLHCDPNDPATLESRYSYNVCADIAALGLQEKVRFTSGFSIQCGLQLEDLVAIYQAADAHMLSSTGEGFGLPTLQAASCGVVPIAPDYTANTELLGAHGLGARVDEYVADEFGIARAFVNVEDAAEKLDVLYYGRSELEVRSREARQFALRYDWGPVCDAWHHLLTRAMERGVPERQGPRPSTVVSLTAGTTVGIRTNGRAYAEAENVDLMRGLTTSVGRLPGGAQVTLHVASQKVGEIGRLVLEDSRADRGSPSLHIPIARTEMTDSRRRRTAGLIFLNGDATGHCGPLFDRLRAIFPILRATQRREDLALAVLALDFDSDDSELSVWTAHFGVPTLGREDNMWQRLLWPDLAVANADVAALVLGRRVLTDFPYASALTRFARGAFDRFVPATLASEVVLSDTALGTTPMKAHAATAG